MFNSTSPPSPPPPPPPHNYLTALGLGYSIAITLGFLVLLITVLLASYICLRTSRNRHHDPRRTTASEGIILPRIMFVAEDEESGGGGAQVGLDQAVINSYPRFQFSRNGAVLVGGGGAADDNNSTCAICLCEYKEGEMGRMMPECRHYFHLSCVDAWLKLNASCPVCRNSPLPTPVSTPLSTPLSELVPISLYAADRRRSL